ncbi:SpoIIE family protein phosphatase [Streptomyces sp. NPDC002853]
MDPQPVSGKSDSPQMRLTSLAVLCAVFALGILDFAYHSAHRGIMVGLAAVPAFGLLLPGPRHRALAPGVLAFATALFVSTDEWRSRPLVVLFTLVDIVLVTWVIWYLGRSRTTAAPLRAVEGSPSGRPDQEVAGAWQLAQVRGEFRRVPGSAPHGNSTLLDDVKATPFGVRLLLADVADESGAASGAASDLRYRWQRLAEAEGSLAEIARRLDVGLSQHSTVRAKLVLMSLPSDGSEADIVCCGHQPPYVLTEGSISPVQILTPVPPLGRFALSSKSIPVYVTKVALSPHRRLLVATGEAAETSTTDSAATSPSLTDKALALDGSEPSRLLDGLVAELRAHAGDSSPGEATLMLVEPATPAPFETADTNQGSSTAA